MSCSTTVTDLVPRQTIESMCQAYQDSLDKYEKGQKLIQESDALARFAFNQYGLPHDAVPGASVDSVRKHLLTSAWRNIFKMTGLRGLMSLEDQGKLDSQLATGNGLPELTPETVLGLLAEQSSKIPDLICSAVKEVFDMIRPCRWNHLKTNEKNVFKIRSKWIWTCALDVAYLFRLSSHSQNRMRALDNAFQLLDGKGPVKEHYSETIKIMEERLRGRGPHQGEFETTYFRVKYFMNGNLHIEFKRMDLVAEMNRIGGEGKFELNRKAS